MCRRNSVVNSIIGRYVTSRSGYSSPDELLFGFAIAKDPNVTSSHSGKYR